MKNVMFLTTNIAMLAVFSILSFISIQTAEAQAGNILYSFCSDACYDGSTPEGSLTPDGYGNFYGLTEFGGTELCPVGLGSCAGGTVFQLIPEPTSGCPSGSTTGNGWCEYVIYNFCTGPGSVYPNCTDGESPAGNLLLVRAGTRQNPVINLYGTASGGSPTGYCDATEQFQACGAVFELTPASPPQGCPSGTNPGNNGWCEKVIYSFCSEPNCADGYEPGPYLVRDSAGNLYGTVNEGVFELSPNGSGGWTETLIYSASMPSIGLAMDGSGNLYGADTSENIFKLYRDSHGSWVGTNIHNFKGYPIDGFEPSGVLEVDSAGNLYGTTSWGGSADHGAAWKLIPVTTGINAGTYQEKILHSFTEKTGYYPVGGVTLDSSGNIYGTTEFGGKYLAQCQYLSYSGCGTVFKLGKSGLTYQYKVLWNFYGANGAFPLDAPFLTSSAQLYGTTSIGGIGLNHSGAVFEVNALWVTTTTKLASSLNPSTYGETVTFTATVSSSAGPPPDGETVTFMKGSTVLGTETLSGGSAVFSTSALAVGTSYIHADYSGDSNFGSSTSNTVGQVVKNTSR